MFEIEADQITALDSQALVHLLKRLMLAESRLAGIPLRAAAVPIQITVPDGGEDGRVEWTGGVDATAYFPHRYTVFQSKAQALTEARAKNEVAKKTAKGRRKLNEAIADVLMRKGAYVIFCREAMVTRKRKILVAAIKAAISEAGGNPKRAVAIEVYDANLIADWANSHPPVALWLAARRLGGSLGSFLTHEGWGQAPAICKRPVMTAVQDAGCQL